MPWTLASPTGAVIGAAIVIAEAAPVFQPQIVAPMNGDVLHLFVKEGQTVAAGDPLLQLEAVKVQTSVRSPSAGRVLKIDVRPGDGVDAGQTMIWLIPVEEGKVRKQRR